MKKGRYLLLKDKQFYTRERRLLGPAITVAKKLDVDFLHIKDLDFQKGLTTNFDIYDKLTYLMPIQVEVYKEKELDTLKDYKVRLIAVPGIFSDATLYNGIITNNKEDTTLFRDIITENSNLLNLDKRIFFLWRYVNNAYAVIFE